MQINCIIFTDVLFLIYKYDVEKKEVKIKMGYCKKWNDKHADIMYMLFRLLVGLMFFMHGAGKLFGWFGGSGGGFSGLMGLAGVLEFLIGIAIVVGMYTRLAAFGGAVVMLVAFVKVHIASGWNPLANGGELALLYFAAFLVLMVYGARKWNLEQKLTGKECF